MSDNQCGLGADLEIVQRHRDHVVLADDMLEGAEQIGAFMGLKARQVYHLQDKLPVFQIGAKLFGRKSTILKWIAEQEGKAA
ncbi:MAG TPA: hypothetical protein VGE72_29045 [Azospirillum sp.]